MTISIEDKTPCQKQLTSQVHNDSVFVLRQVYHEKLESLRFACLTFVMSSQTQNKNDPCELVYCEINDTLKKVRRTVLDSITR